MPLPQWRRDPPNPEDLAKQIAERLAAAKPSPSDSSGRDTVLSGRRVITVISFGIVVLGLVTGFNWLAEVGAVREAEVLNATLTNDDVGGDDFRPLAESSTTAGSGQTPRSVSLSTTTTSILLPGIVATTAPSPGQVTMPPATTTTSTAAVTTVPIPVTTMPTPSPSTSALVTTSTSLVSTTSTVAPPTSTTFPASTTTILTTTTLPSTTTTLVEASTTTVASTTTTCGNQGNGQGNC